jgi:hypothetical protein
MQPSTKAVIQGYYMWNETSQRKSHGIYVFVEKGGAIWSESSVDVVCVMGARATRERGHLANNCTAPQLRHTSERRFEIWPDGMCHGWSSGVRASPPAPSARRRGLLQNGHWVTSGIGMSKGSCIGLVFQVSAAHARNETLAWPREKTGSIRGTWRAGHGIQEEI